MLNADVLRAGLLDLQAAFPASTEEAAEKWSKLYTIYAKSAVSGVVIPEVDIVGLYSSFLSSMLSGKFMEDLGSNLGLFWKKSVWSGPSATGFVSYADGAELQSSSLGSEILEKSMTSEQVADFLSKKIHEWTLKVQVTSTVSSNVVVANIL